MVQSGCVAKPRAYLATAIRNARKKRQAEASTTDRGGYLASWLPDGRKPWEDPPEPEKVEQPSNPAIWPDSAPIGGDPRPAQPQKSFRRHWDTFVAPRASPRLEHGQAGDGLGRHAPD